MMAESKAENRWTRIGKPLVFWVSIIALGAFVFSLWHWLPGYLTSSHSSIITRGAYGDTYGSVTALFTGLPLRVIVTIFLQTRELREQRKELKAQREGVGSPTEEQHQIEPN